MSVHGSQPDLVLAVSLQLSEEHAVAVGGAAEGGRVRDERQVVPGGGVGVRLGAPHSLQGSASNICNNREYYRNAGRTFCINLCQSMIFFCHHH